MCDNLFSQLTKDIHFVNISKSCFFGIVFFIVEQQKKQSIFSCFSSWYDTIKTSLKRQINGKLEKAIFIGFSPFRAPFYKRSLLATVSASPAPESLSAFRLAVISLPCQSPLVKGLDECPFCIQSHYKPAPFRNIFQFSESWNLIPSWFPS